MNQMNTNVIFLLEMLGQMFGTIDRSVLPTGATEGHLEVGEIPFDIALYMMVHQGINRLQEGQYLTVIFKEVNDRLVQTRHGLIRVVSTRIMGGTAVEDVPASITGFISRKSAFKREGVDRY